MRRKLKTYLSPPDLIIEAAGSLQAVADIVDVSATAVYYWRNSGYIPSPRLPAILLASRKRKWEITAEELILGRKIYV